MEVKKTEKEKERTQNGIEIVESRENKKTKTKQYCKNR